MRRVIPQLSDLHLGPAFNQERGELVLQEAHDMQPIWWLAARAYWMV